MLTCKERLERSIRREETDRPPCICPGGMMNMITTDLMKLAGVFLPAAHADAGMMAELAGAVYGAGCFENYGVPFCMTIEAEEMGAKVDMGSEIYEPHVVDYAIETVSDWQGLNSIDITQGRAKVVLDAIGLLKAKGDGVPVIGNLTGPISTASSVMEPVVFYKELRKKKTDAHACMAFVTEQLIRFGRAQVAAGADVIAISDPSGTGEILGPKMFEEYAVTYINRLLEALGEVATIVHICGQMRNVYPQVDKINSNVLSFDSIVHMGDARQNLGDRVLMGNVSTYALEFGDSGTVINQTRTCIKNGTDIVSPACGLGMKSPMTNIQSMLGYVKSLESGGENHD